MTTLVNNKYNLLSVLLHTDSFFYKSYDATGKLMSTVEGSTSNSNWLDSNEADKKLICYSGLPFTHVPFNELDPLKLESYLSHLSYILDPNDWILNYDRLSTQNLATVYAIPTEKVDKVTSTIADKHSRHISTLLIDYNNSSNKNGVFVHLHGKEAYITVINKLRLEYYNHISVNSIDDLLYFIGLTYEKLAHDRSSFPVVFSGNIHKDFDLYKKLKSYFACIFFQGVDHSFLENSSDFSVEFLDHLISICES